MKTFSEKSTLEILPDEILLEVCKYLLCVDILQTFFGLNSRMTRMISRYRHHVSLHKATFNQLPYICMNVLPQIGSHIRSLLIDCCYSVLQDDLFIKYFDNKMSMMFPSLEKISLVTFQKDRLIAFLNTLYNLNHLIELHLYELFDINRDQQPVVLQKLMQVNNYQLSSISIDAKSSCLCFSHGDCFVNILQLRINIETVTDLPFLFTAVPNVHYLDVTIEPGDETPVHVDKMIISPLLYLTEFRLKSIKRRWILEELVVLLSQLPIVERLSLFLATDDTYLAQGNTLLPLLPSTVQQFNYALFYIYGTQPNQDEAIVTSWPPSHPVRCIVSDTFLLIHMLPCHLASIGFRLATIKTISSQTNRSADYDKQIETLDVELNKNFTLFKSLAIISQCRRVREINFWMDERGNPVQGEQQPMPCLPNLSRLLQISLNGSISPDLDHLSVIFIAAPNLFRLDLPFDYLMKLLENQQMRNLLRQRITSVSIYSSSHSSAVTLTEEHIPIIASTFTRLRDLYVDLIHLPTSTTIQSDEDVSIISTILTSLFGSWLHKHETIIPLSRESMILCVLTEFKEHGLVTLCMGGRFHKKIELDAKKWLQTNTRLGKQRFDAVFMKDLEQLFVWM